MVKQVNSIPSLYKRYTKHITKDGNVISYDLISNVINTILKSPPIRGCKIKGGWPE